MKSYLSIVGGLFILTCVVVAYFIGYDPFSTQNLQQSSKSYIEANIPPIISTWSKDELLKRASPQLLNSVNEHPNSLDKQFKTLSKLGAMRSFGNVEGFASNYTTNQDRIVTTASYVATAKFANGRAHISAQLIQSHGQWRFSQFKVDSPLLHK